MSSFQSNDRLDNGSMKVLVVEDDAFIAMELAAALSDAGHVVRGPTSTATRALEIVALSMPDIALIDINLRDGKGRGIVLARELRDRWSLPSIFVSGQRADAIANQDAAYGFIGKPFDSKTVVEAIRVMRRIKAGHAVCFAKLPSGFELFPRGMAV